MIGKVLLLNQSYLPLAVLKMRKAMNKWINGKADILEEQEEGFMYNGKMQNFPIVMVMKYKVDVSKKRNLKDFYTKTNVWKRDKGICQYCGKKVSIQEFTVDHIVPKKYGGKGEWTNIVTACFHCNNLKDSKNLKPDGTLTIKTKDKKTYHLKLLKRPKVPNLPESIQQTLIYKLRNLKKIEHISWKKYLV